MLGEKSFTKHVSVHVDVYNAHYREARHVSGRSGTLSGIWPVVVVPFGQKLAVWTQFQIHSFEETRNVELSMQELFIEVNLS